MLESSATLLVIVKVAIWFLRIIEAKATVAPKNPLT